MWVIAVHSVRLNVRIARAWLGSVPASVEGIIRLENEAAMESRLAVMREAVGIRS